MMDVFFQNLGNAEGKVARANVTIQGDAAALQALRHAIDSALTTGIVTMQDVSIGGAPVHVIVDRIGPAIKGN